MERDGDRRPDPEALAGSVDLDFGSIGNGSE